MDARGCGLSDREVGDFTLEHYVNDLEAVVDAAGVERFSLFGHSQGGATAIGYAARHAQRVTHLVLLGAYASGWFRRRDLPPERLAELEAQLKLVEVGWGRDDATYRTMFSTQFMPGATLEQLKALSELQRVSAPADNAARLMRSFLNIEVGEAAARIACPTLVVHARGDVRVPFEAGRQLASLIPDARFVPLETSNHILLEHEPAFARFFEELDGFLPGGAVHAFGSLTSREAEILERIAQGLDNGQIAARLELSEKTVRNHITHIFDKIGVESRAQAIVLARDRGLGRESRSS
jgi:pimeloyl-ACP methyl ester carboxylesterase/DNA-binding CsgD family transcriptional regulator